MKKRRLPSRIGRKRRTLGWTLLTLGLMVAGVWVASGWKALSIPGPRGGGEHYNIHRGRLLAADRLLVETFYGNPPNPQWELGYGLQGGFLDSIEGWALPLWPVPLLLWTPAALLLRSGILARRRANTGQCAKCGYSLAGLGADAPCPECGKAATSPPKATSRRSS